MVERDGAKGVANKSGCTSDWLTYCKLRNYVTKLNKKKKKLSYEAKVNRCSQLVPSRIAPTEKKIFLVR